MGGRVGLGLVAALLSMSACLEPSAPPGDGGVDGGPDCGRFCGIVTAVQRSTEPSAAIDPTDPDRIIVAAIEGAGPLLQPGQQNVPWQYPGWAFLSVRYSHDSGATWKRVPMPYATNAAPTSQWAKFCVTADPVLLFDARGVAYLFGLGWPCSQNTPVASPATTSVGAIWVSTSRDGGVTWSDAAIVAQSPGLAEWPDKEWAAIDPKTGRILVVWQGLSRTDQVLRFSVSADQGRTWSTPGSVTSNAAERSNAVLMPMPVFDDRGNAYVAYRACNGQCLKVARSSDLATWQSVEAAKVTIVQRSGGLALMTWIPSLAFDARTGLLVANWQGGESGSDVWIAASADGGVTWGDAWAVNADTAGDATDQYMSWMSGSGDGFVHLFYYDRQAGNETRARYARVDLGNRTSSLAWASPVGEPVGGQAPFNGDYQAAAAVPGRAVVAWAQTMPQGQRPVSASVFGS